MKNYFYKYIFIFSLAVFVFLIISPQNSYAADSKNLPAITIINPIRGNELGHEKDDLLSGLKTQWRYTADTNVNATWLWQYSALENDAMVNFAKTNMKNQEFGIFLEIDRNFAKQAGVQYRGQGPWYFSDGLLLTSYDKSERKKLIDTVFNKFKKTFGFYPKTVGAWWIGADSLVYMQKKYGIVAAMRASDQFDLDVYSIWGTPWSIPYVASRENEGLPAEEVDDSSKVVMLQWAPRDPTRGYNDFAYSIQDFTLRDDNFSYVNYLTSVFLRNSFDNMVIGLENSGTTAPLEIYYTKIVKKARELVDKHQVRIVLAKDYAAEFLKTDKPFANSEVKFFLNNDYKSNDQSFWYNSTNYRAGIIKTGDSIYLVDLRDYSSRRKEDFFDLSNSQGYLRIVITSVIDSVRFPESKLLISKTANTLSIKQNKNDVVLLNGSNKIAKFSNSSMDLYPDAGGIKTFIFNNKPIADNLFDIFIVIFLLYAVIIYFHKKNLPVALLHLFILSVPLFIAYPYLNSGFTNTNFIFDRKELVGLYLLSGLKFLSITNLIILLKIIPFVFLMTAHYCLVVLNSKFVYKFIYYFILSFITLIYAHVGYFPLDKSTYIVVALLFGLIFLLLVVLSIFLWKKTKNKRLLVGFLASIPFILVILAVIVYISRTKIIIPQFEIDALKIIKRQHKNVLFVTENNYNIRPIYKAVKPLLYENYHLGERLTDTHWQIIIRPENNILKIANYDNKLIVVPRYLGADLSVKEMQLLKLKKIFDNAQIAIFEKK